MRVLAEEESPLHGDGPPSAGAVAVPDVAYSVEFTHRQTEIRRRRSLAFCLPVLIAFLLFRLLFFK